MTARLRPGLVRIPIALLATGATWLAPAVPAAAQSRYQPALRFQTLTTPHFVIHFHQGEEQRAHHLAGIAEDVHRLLATRLTTRPAGRTHVILADQHDRPNGWATTLPINTIEIDAAWPSNDDLLGNTADWLRLVFAHEYTHILQVDQSRGLARVARDLFGRSPLAFPNMYLAGWLTEGLATYEESAVTGAGRIRSGSFEAIVDAPLRAGQAQPIDRVGGGLIAWPSGTAPYAWGGYFVQYLADRFGEARLAALARDTAGRFYFLSSPAFTRVFGQNLGTLWRDFLETRAEALGAPASAPADRVRLTTHGYIVTTPRSVGNAVIYSVVNAHEFPALMSIPLDGSAPARRLADRYLGSGLGEAQGLVWFSQLELEDSVALRSDLYVLARATGTVRRVTRAARYLDPDVTLDGRTVVAVAIRDGRRRLAVLDVRGDPSRPAALSVAERALLGEEGAEYSSPRWSPDGRLIAAARVWHGGGSEIVIIDPASAQARALASAPGSRSATPCWTPDGRSILFASDRAGGGPLNLFAIDLADAEAPGALPPVFQVTSEPGGAAAPTVSPDGRRIVYVGYTTDGYDLFSTPLDRRTWTRWTGARESGGDLGPATTGRDPAPDVRGPFPYSPWVTLGPRYWLPDLDVDRAQARIGVQTSGTDVLGRHAWAAEALWRWPRDGSAGVEARPDWRVSYVYDRWRPTFFANVSDETRLYRTAADPDGADLVDRVRVREGTAGVVLPFRASRRAQTWTASFAWQRQTVFTRAGRWGQGNRHAARFAWSFNSAKIYTASIGPEQGVAASVTSEHVREAFGADGNADAVTAQARGFLRLGPPHATLAARVAAGAASGDRQARRLFYLGSAGPAPGLIDFGGDALNLLRGFDGAVLAGARLAGASIEYRLPLARIERGIRAWPLFVRTLHTTVFVDAGAVWTDRLRPDDLRRAWGAEVSLDVVLGYGWPVTCTAGVARPHDPGGFVRGTTAYVRIGRAF